MTADLRRGPGEPVSWRELAPGDAESPVVASEKVVRRIMREEGLVARKAAQMRRRARYRSYRGELAERPANVPLRADGTHDFRAPAPGLLVVTDVTEFRLDGYRAYLSPAIDCFDGWPICWRVSVHADSDLMVGMLRDLVGIVGPTEDRPLTVHTDGGAVYMGRERREACGPGVRRSMSRRARSPDNARRGVLRHAQVRLLRGQGLDRRAVRRVLPAARRIYRVVQGRQAQEGPRMEDH